jgi:hypothetical protein
MALNDCNRFKGFFQRLSLFIVSSFGFRHRPVGMFIDVKRLLPQQTQVMGTCQVASILSAISTSSSRRLSRSRILSQLPTAPPEQS